MKGRQMGNFVRPRAGLWELDSVFCNDITNCFSAQICEFVFFIGHKSITQLIVPLEYNSCKRNRLKVSTISLIDHCFLISLISSETISLMYDLIFPFCFLWSSHWNPTILSLYSPLLLLSHSSSPLNSPNTPSPTRTHWGSAHRMVQAATTAATLDCSLSLRCILFPLCLRLSLFW